MDLWVNNTKDNVSVKDRRTMNRTAEAEVAGGAWSREKDGLCCDLWFRHRGKWARFESGVTRISIRETQ